MVGPLSWFVTAHLPSMNSNEGASLSQTKRNGLGPVEAQGLCSFGTEAVLVRVHHPCNEITSALVVPVT